MNAREFQERGETNSGKGGDNERFPKTKHLTRCARDSDRTSGESYAAVRYHFTEFFSGHSIDCLHSFGDLEKMFVMEFVRHKRLSADFGTGVTIKQPSDEVAASVKASEISA